MIIEQHIESFPAPYNLWAEELRQIILNLHPAIEESYKWRLPYYKLGKGFVFIHFDKNQNLYLGLMCGYKIIDEFNLLSGDGKLVRKYNINKHSDLFNPEFAALLQQAVGINLSAFSRKKR